MASAKLSPASTSVRTLATIGVQPADVLVAGKKFERIVEPRAGLEQQREVAGEDGHVLAARLVEQADGEVRNRRAAVAGNGLDRNEAEIFDPMRDLGGVRRRRSCH